MQPLYGILSIHDFESFKPMLIDQNSHNSLLIPSKIQNPPNPNTIDLMHHLNLCC